MAGALYADSKNIRTGLRPFEAVLNELIAHHGCTRRVCRAGHLGWTTIEALRLDHKLSRTTMQKLTNLRAQMREEKERLKNAA